MSVLLYHTCVLSGRPTGIPDRAVDGVKSPGSFLSLDSPPRVAPEVETTEGPEHPRKKGTVPTDDDGFREVRTCVSSLPPRTTVRRVQVGVNGTSPLRRNL